MLIIAGLVLAAAAQAAAQQPQSVQGTERFTRRVVASGLAGPWEVAWGPDDQLWVTERIARQVVRINPEDGTKTIAVLIDEVRQLEPQDGLLGMALHPALLQNRGTDFVYVAYTYDADPGPADARRLKVRRYTYNPGTGKLTEPLDVLANLPAGSDHVAGRLAFGPDQKLYLSLGDQGNNQFSLYCTPIRAQELPTAAEIAAGNFDHYQGKILRLNLDGSVPADNPTFNGVRSHIFTTGHRNPQGLAFAPDGNLYSSEHGPSMDDELNRIVGGKNYGWPHVAGYQDDRVYVDANWSGAAPQPCASLKWDAIVAPPGVPQEKETAWRDPAFAPPIQTFFTVDRDFDFSKANATIAPSGIEVYARRNGIPGWSNSVLVTSLMRGIVYRVKLSADGTSHTGIPVEYFKSNARFRDVAISPDGLTIYVAADRGAQENPDSILAFTYQRR
jgi:PQQ-dependent dehydrogenase (s-GDH family)